MKTIPQLKQWLFNKPIIFSLMFFGLVTVLGLAYSLVQTFLHFETVIPVYIIFAVALLYSVYYMIKKLPHDKMPRNDFIAIVNGASIISIVSSIIAIFVISFYGVKLQQKMMMMYLLHPTTFTVIFLAVVLFSLYILGVAISGIYAKYKRVTTMGVSPWKAILSMPFAFLMLWTPGYLIEEKGKKTNLLIKSKWYNRFNNWVISNFSNTLFIFLFLVFAKSVIAGLSTSVLTVALLIIYTLWYVKHKSDFVKNINDGYALTSVGINIATIIAMAVLSI